MAVLVEAISVIIRRATIEKKYPGGWEGFVSNAPNDTLCADEDIARLGFMTPDDVEVFVKRLEGFGFRFLAEGKAVDLAVADQIHGITAPCDWLEFGRVNLSDNSDTCAACRLTQSKSGEFATPKGWAYKKSLSRHFGYVPSEHAGRSVKYLRHENGMDVYLNVLTGQEVYIGRTS